MTKVLIVEDEPAMAVALQDGFSFEGYDVVMAGDGLEALKLAECENPDLILLDVMLPKMSGLDVCKKLRGNGETAPIIMVSARGQEIDKVLGLKLGADDYVTKPFSFMELVARAEAVLRRSRGKTTEEKTFEFDDISVDFRGHEVRRNNELIDFSQREFRLLKYFIEHAGEVVTRDTLLDEVWDHDKAPLTRTVDMHLAKLRKKLERNPAEPIHFVTVHRLGYKFVP